MLTLNVIIQKEPPNFLLLTTEKKSQQTNISNKNEELNVSEGSMYPVQFTSTVLIKLPPHSPTCLQQNAALKDL